MMTKCILFDADGVVVVSDRFSVQYQKEYGIPDNDMLAFFNGEFKKCTVGKADLAKIVKPWLLKWKWEKSADEFLRYWFELEHNIDERVVSAISSLRDRGILCYLATNQEKYRTQYMREYMGFDELFDGVFSSCEIGHKKPAKEYYEFILDKMKSEKGILPGEILFFDDRKDNVEQAKKLGINAYLYQGFEEFLDLINSI